MELVAQSGKSLWSLQWTDELDDVTKSRLAIMIRDVGAILELYKISTNTELLLPALPMIERGYPRLSDVKGEIHGQRS